MPSGPSLTITYTFEGSCASSRSFSSIIWNISVTGALIGSFKDAAIWFLNAAVKRLDLSGIELRPRATLSSDCELELPSLDILKITTK